MKALKGSIYIGIVFFILSIFSSIFANITYTPVAQMPNITIEDICTSTPSHMDCKTTVCPITQDDEICCCDELRSGTAPIIISQSSLFDGKIPETISLRENRTGFYKTTYLFSIQSFNYNGFFKPPQTLFS